MSRETKNNQSEAIDKQKAEELSETQKAKAEIAQLLEEAKAQASEIVSKAKAEASEIAEAAKSKAAPSAAISEADIARGEELVEVFLFKDSGKYSDDVYVAVNGENCQIQRGVPVKIKRKFHEVLMNSQAQDTLAANRAQQLSDEFAQKTKKLGE